MAVAKITKRSVDALAPGQQLFDPEIKGFMVRAYDSRKVYALKYVFGGKQRIFTIGDHGERTDDGKSMTPENARKAALSLRGRIAGGEDPQGQRRSGRDALSRAPLISALADRYLREHVALHNKESTAKDITNIIENKVKPRFGSFRVAEVARKDVKEWHASMSGTPYQANRALAYFQKMMELVSSDWELRGDNPCHGVKRFPEKKRERFFAEDELQAIGSAMRAIAVDEKLSQDSDLVTAIALARFLALTGMRLSEARTLRWSFVDLKHHALHLPDAKAGSRTTPLGAPAAALLADIQPRQTFVFQSVNDDPERPIPESSVRRLWKHVRKLAKLENGRPHDLRHTIGTYSAQTGANAFVVRDILGHKTLAMTGRYVEKAVNPLRATINKTTNRVDAAMSGATGKVLPLRGRGARKAGGSGAYPTTQ